MKELQRHLLDTIKTSKVVSRDFIDLYVEDQMPGTSIKSVGQNLKALREAGIIVEVEDGWTVVLKPEVVVSNSDLERKGIAHFFHRITAQIVTLVYGEDEVDDVVRIEYQKNSEWYPMILQSGMRVMLGKSIPKWHPSQVTVYGVSRVRLTLRDGKVIEKNILSINDPVTFAPLED